MVNPIEMDAQLVLHEGLKLKVYLDTEGYRTIAVGYNIDARGWEFFEKVIGRRLVEPVTVTRSEALRVLRADVVRVEAAVRAHLPDLYPKLDEVRQRVAVDMAFNMGTRALGFKKVLDAVRRRDWSTAARELYQSKWSRQVGDGPGGKWDRCDRLSKMVLTGQPPSDVPALIV